MSSQFNEILAQLEGLTENDNEYFSHQLALYFLGLVKEPPSVLTMVSARRRRNRRLGNYELVFVYHGKAPANFIQTTVFEGKKFKVSTIEKTLSDLCKDSAYAPPVTDLALLFCRVSYNHKILLNIARQTSDSVLKRVSLFLAWSGRVSYNEIPYKLFKRTPVKLDTREEHNLIWNSLFYCRLPEALLKLPPACPPEDAEKETRLWMELRALPEFCEKQLQAGMIFIRETPKPRIQAVIESYFIEIFKSIEIGKLEWLLENSNESSTETDFPPPLPRLLISYITSRSNILNLRYEEISDWVNRNFHSQDLKKAEAAIFFGTLIGYEEDVIQAFTRFSSQFFYAGRFSIILFFAQNFLNRGLSFAHNVYLDISKTYSAHEKFEEALQLLEEAKVTNGDTDDAVIGHLYYATALVLKRLNRNEEALSELFLARETFDLARDYEPLARTENALGNLYFSIGHAESAKSQYLAGIHHARLSGNKSLQPSFLTNLGLVEYDLGFFKKAKILLARAYNLYKMQQNLWNASVTGIGLGKIYLKVGHFFKAMKIFREVIKIREDKKNYSGLYEINSLLAWICEILGKTASAQAYWKQADSVLATSRIEPRAQYVGESLKAMKMLYCQDFKNAEKQYRQMLDCCMSRKSSKIRTGDCEHGLASSLIFQGRLEEGFHYLDSALSNLDQGGARVQLLQIRLLATLYYPEYFKNHALKNILAQLMETGVYEPFWGNLAAQILESEPVKGKKFIQNHIERTPPSMLKQILSNVKNLEPMIKDLMVEISRASEFYTLIKHNETRTLHKDEYQDQVKSFPENELCFDAPTGKLCYNRNSTVFKPGSIPHSVLLQLFIVQPHFIDIPSLYRSAWGTDFDPEYDTGAFKTTIQRIKHHLKSICPTARIIRKKNADGIACLKLMMAVPWTVIFK